MLREGTYYIPEALRDPCTQILLMTLESSQLAPHNCNAVIHYPNIFLFLYLG